jgi:hypothetical protein
MFDRDGRESVWKRVVVSPKLGICKHNYWSAMLRFLLFCRMDYTENRGVGMCYCQPHDGVLFISVLFTIFSSL